VRQRGLADLVLDVAAGWQRAFPEQRNRLARLLFEEVVINENQVVSVKPRPELAGFFALDYEQRDTAYVTSGPDGRRIISKYSRVTACLTAPILSLSYLRGQPARPLVQGSAVWVAWLERRAPGTSCAFGRLR
jgi:hypothetical protein